MDRSATHHLNIRVAWRDVGGAVGSASRRPGMPSASIAEADGLGGWRFRRRFGHAIQIFVKQDGGASRCAISSALSRRLNVRPSASRARSRRGALSLAPPRAWGASSPSMMRPMSSSRPKEIARPLPGRRADPLGIAHDVVELQLLDAALCDQPTTANPIPAGRGAGHSTKLHSPGCFRRSRIFAAAS